MSTTPSTPDDRKTSILTKPECPTSRPVLDSAGVPIDSEFLSFPSGEDLCEMLGTRTSTAANGLTSLAFGGLGRQGKYYRPFILAMATELAPRDPIEGMLVTQITLAHLGCARSMGKMLDAADAQSCEAESRISARMSQAMNGQMETLRRHRSGDLTNISVGQVMIQDGGQAIVGAVQAEPHRDDK